MHSRAGSLICCRAVVQICSPKDWRVQLDDDLYWHVHTSAYHYILNDELTEIGN